MLQKGNRMGVGVILNRRRMGVGLVLTGKGRDRIFFFRMGFFCCGSGMGWDGSENPLHSHCHSLFGSYNVFLLFCHLSLSGGVKEGKMWAECRIEGLLNVLQYTRRLYFMQTRALLFRCLVEEKCCTWCLYLYTLMWFNRDKERLHTAADMFLEVVLKRDFPAFITTYLNEEHTFLIAHQRTQLEILDKSKLWFSCSMIINDSPHAVFKLKFFGMFSVIIAP